MTLAERDARDVVIPLPRLAATDDPAGGASDAPPLGLWQTGAQYGRRPET